LTKIASIDRASRPGRRTREQHIVERGVQAEAEDGAEDARLQRQDDELFEIHHSPCVAVAPRSERDADADDGAVELLTEMNRFRQQRVVDRDPERAITEIEEEVRRR